jgi:nucleoside-diphosphate-sugar epimerase
MRVLIVGCGYVGTPLGKELVRRGHDVHGLRRNPQAQDALKSAGIHPLFADITRQEDLAKLPAKFDWVIHCVSSGGGGVEEYRRTYPEGMRNVLRWLAPDPPKKFVYTSSTGVYGQTDGAAVDETSATEPTAATAQILVETEKLVCDAVRLNGIPGMILRVAGIYGPGRDRSFRQFFQNEAHIEGDGRRIMNMIHRDDVAGCIIAVLEKGQPGEIYNAVDDEPVSQLHFFEWLARASGQPLPPSRPEAPDLRRRGNTSKRVSNRKLKTMLGYRFKHPDFRAGYLAGIQAPGAEQ